MTKVMPFAAALVLAVGFGGAAAAQRSVANAAPPAHVACKQGAKRAMIGGRVRCLRIGMRCDSRFNTTKPSYRRYGFICGWWYSSAPTTLFLIAKPKAAPATCNGIAPTPFSAHPGSTDMWAGGPSLWLGPYLDLRSAAEDGI